MQWDAVFPTEYFQTVFRLKDASGTANSVNLMWARWRVIAVEIVEQ